jgi:ABC-type antimicrobial peptide transport system permease subunit
MSAASLILRSLFHYRRQHAGLLLTAVLVCGILTGALIVGDSVKQSLRAIAADRLGGIHYAMQWRNRLFSEDIARKIAAKGLDAAPVLMLPGVAAVLPEAAGPKFAVNRAQVIGIDAGFRKFAPQPFTLDLAPQEAAINEKTASALGVHVGDDILLRIVKPAAMPLDAPLASHKKADMTASVVTVKAVLTGAQLGKFSLAAEQTTPYNVFVSRAWLQEQVEQPDAANLIVASSTAPGEDARNALHEAWMLEDIGLRIRSHSGLLQLESSRVFIDEEIVRAAMKISGAQPTITYLVNSIAANAKKTPYSFVEAGPTPESMPDDEVVINQWLAEQLSAQPGNKLSVEYLKLLPQNTFSTQSRAFRIHSIVPMTQWMIERELAPQFPGLSDVESCSDWSIGMPMDETSLKDPANELYWKSYKQTPKLMTTFNAGREMWANQFGSVTAIRFPSATVSENELRQQLKAQADPLKLGLDFIDVRKSARDAVNQAMDFGGLFAGMSSFLIIAALILLGLVCSFAIQSRSAETGLLAAVGFPASKIRRLFLLETVPALFLGSVTGIVAGIIYARAIIAGLAALWPAAVAGTQVQFYMAATTPVMGASASFLAGIAVTFAAICRNTRLAPGELVNTPAGSGAPVPSRFKFRLYSFLAALIVIAAIVVAIFAVKTQSNLVEPFFMISTMCLISGIFAMKAFLLYLARRDTFKRPSLWKVSLTNLVRRPGRSLSVAGITSCGCFIIFSVSSMQENLSAHAGERASGTGGFQIYAETTAPMHGSRSDISKAIGLDAVPIRLHDGDHAGCLNLNHAQSPPILGVNVQTMIDAGAFARDPSVWQLLNEPCADGAIPALVGDSDTAMWGIQKKVGVDDGDVVTIRDEAGRDVRLKLAGQLPMRLSVFQGSLLISDEQFTRLFPSESGFRIFLLNAAAPDITTQAARLNTSFSDVGMLALPAVDRLRDFYAIECTYLAMFRVLGALGLALGAGGLSVVIMRNILERRTELAILHAVGYDKRTIHKLLLLEYGILAAVGIAIGVSASAAGILPLAILARTVVSPAVLLILLAVIIAANGAAVWLPLRLALPRDLAQSLNAE